MAVRVTSAVEETGIGPNTVEARSRCGVGGGSPQFTRLEELPWLSRLARLVKVAKNSVGFAGARHRTLATAGCRKKEDERANSC